MKYKVGIASTKPMNVVAVRSSRIIPLSIKNGTNKKAVIPIVSASIEPSFLGNLSFRGWPRLFRNVLSSVYITLLNITNSFGNTHNVSSTNKILSNISLMAILKHIPSQKIKFQRLSLFSRDLIQSIMGLRFKVHEKTISWFDIFVKQIIKGLITIIISFLQTIAFAQNQEKALISLISSVEKEYNIPSGLLRAIAEVESNLNAYSINASGKSFIATSSLEASRMVRSYHNQGYTNIDVGLVQINWHWHGRNFRSIEEMLTPKNNIQYAAKLLTALYRQHGDWQKVVRLYHSAKPQHHKKYSRKVLLSWLDG